MKKVLISVTRGLVARNILRCGVLDALLKNQDVEVMIAVPKIETYFEEEFHHPRIQIVVIPKTHSSAVERMIQPIYRNLVFTENEELHMRWGSTLKRLRKGLLLDVKIQLFRLLGSWKGLKRVARVLSSWIPPQSEYVEFIQRMDPDVVFATDVQGVHDVALQRAARACNVPVVAMTKGWENAARRFYWILPDILLVLNDQVRRDAIEYQLVPESRMRLVGFPQFDAYVRPDNRVISREAHLKRLGFASDRKLALFGSEGHWSANDDRIVEKLIQWNQTGVFGFPLGIVLRPHFSDASNSRYDRFRGIPDVYVDDRFRLSAMFPDQWDPSKEDIAWFLNHIAHLDVMVTFSSTLTLDAAMLDKPAINVAYGAHFSADGQDLTYIMFGLHHYKNVLTTGAVDLVRSDEELIRAIREAFFHPEAHAAGRVRLRDVYCAKSDGDSATRIAEIVLGMARERTK